VEKEKDEYKAYCSLPAPTDVIQEFLRTGRPRNKHFQNCQSLLLIRWRYRPSYSCAINAIVRASLARSAATEARAATAAMLADPTAAADPAIARPGLLITASPNALSYTLPYAFSNILSGSFPGGFSSSFLPSGVNSTAGARQRQASARAHGKI
jgi:hypothetical protein